MLTGWLWSRRFCLVWGMSFQWCPKYQKNISSEERAFALCQTAFTSCPQNPLHWCYLSLLHCPLTLEPSFLAFQHAPKMSRSPGLLQVFLMGLGLLSHRAMWTEKLSGSWPLQCEVSHCWTTRLYQVSQYDKYPLDLYSFYWFCSSRE